MPGLEISFQNLKIQAMKTPVSKQAISSPRRISARTVFPQKSALESFKSQPLSREGGGGCNPSGKYGMHFIERTFGPLL